MPRHSSAKTSDGGPHVAFATLAALGSRKLSPRGPPPCGYSGDFPRGVLRGSPCPASSFQIDARIGRDRLAPRSLAGAITILTDDPAFPTLTVRVGGTLVR